MTLTGERVGCPRALSAVVFAAVCVVTTALGHALMSGDLLPWWALGVAFTGTVSTGWWLTGRERGAMTVVGVTTVVQGLLHLLFDLAHEMAHGPVRSAEAGSASGMDHAMTVSHSGMAMHMDHSMTGMSMAHSGTAGTSHVLPMLSAAAQQGPAAMFLAHLLAAVVCGVWLWRGETAMYRLGRALAVVLFAPLRRVRRLLGRPVPDPRTLAGRMAPGAGPASLRAFTVLRHAVVRRGPPCDRSAVPCASFGPLFALRS
ncbi:hypothetical protein OG895_36385 [Streptomyces sp. NBC_00201]|uniref:hypothetical protein n=1 Tax=unclassified Streptomyces TaxID=2593676 RepID=UPI0022500424|nr:MULTISPECIES: hypothetical protein [unclassified Streptomyces]MCX5250619.1 hypothetical protein [Streptomyces sp. NBC_00201]MCX5291452.1 hypothetical protein [Streptomyces sp. NBC_00183]